MIRFGIIFWILISNSCAVFASDAESYTKSVDQMLFDIGLYTAISDHCKFVPERELLRSIDLEISRSSGPYSGNASYFTAMVNDLFGNIKQNHPRFEEVEKWMCSKETQSTINFESKRILNVIRSTV